MTSTSFTTSSDGSPQNPFLPRYVPEGPSFLDTGACLCALQPIPDDANDLAAWQCIGNQTEGVYNVTSGKWFNTLHGGSKVNLPIYDASNGPDPSKTLRWDDQQDGLVAASDEKQFNDYDLACTAVNQTAYSASFYGAAAQIAKNQMPTSAALCYQAGAVPIQIHNLTYWEEHGCSDGFLCQSLLVISQRLGCTQNVLANTHQVLITALTVCRNIAPQLPHVLSCAWLARSVRGRARISAWASSSR